MTNVPHPIGVGGGCSCATVQQAALLAASTPAAANCVLVGCGVLGSASGRQVYGAAETHQHRIKRGCSVVAALFVTWPLTQQQPAVLGDVRLGALPLLRNLFRKSAPRKKGQTRER